MPRNRGGVPIFPLPVRQAPHPTPPTQTPVKMPQWSGNGIVWGYNWPTQTGAETVMKEQISGQPDPFSPYINQNNPLTQKRTAEQAGLTGAGQAQQPAVDERKAAKGLERVQVQTETVLLQARNAHEKNETVQAIQQVHTVIHNATEGLKNGTVEVQEAAKNVTAAVNVLENTTIVDLAVKKNVTRIVNQTQTWGSWAIDLYRKIVPETIPEGAQNPLSGGLIQQSLNTQDGTTPNVNPAYHRPSPEYIAQVLAKAKAMLTTSVELTMILAEQNKTEMAQHADNITNALNNSTQAIQSSFNNGTQMVMNSTDTGLGNRTSSTPSFGNSTSSFGNSTSGLGQNASSSDQPTDLQDNLGKSINDTFNETKKLADELPDSAEKTRILETIQSVFSTIWDVFGTGVGMGWDLGKSVVGGVGDMAEYAWNHPKFYEGAGFAVGVGALKYLRGRPRGGGYDPGGAWALKGRMNAKEYYDLCIKIAYHLGPFKPAINDLGIEWRRPMNWRGPNWQQGYLVNPSDYGLFADQVLSKGEYNKLFSAAYDMGARADAEGIMDRVLRTQQNLDLANFLPKDALDEDEAKQLIAKLSDPKEIPKSIKRGLKMLLEMRENEEYERYEGLTEEGFDFLANIGAEALHNGHLAHVPHPNEAQQGLLNKAANYIKKHKLSTFALLAVAAGIYLKGGDILREIKHLIQGEPYVPQTMNDEERAAFEQRAKDAAEGQKRAGERYELDAEGNQVRAKPSNTLERGEIKPPSQNNIDILKDVKLVIEGDRVVSVQYKGLTVNQRQYRNFFAKNFLAGDRLASLVVKLSKEPRKTFTIKDLTYESQRGVFTVTFEEMEDELLIPK